MKEVTYEDWQKNPTPRMMWVWDDNEEEKKQLKVLYIVKCEIFPVITTTPNNSGIDQYRHCAEIEEPKTRRMTNRELACWLSKAPNRELKINSYVYHDYDYKESEQNDEVEDFLLIREDYKEWREPLIEVEE